MSDDATHRPRPGSPDSRDRPRRFAFVFVCQHGSLEVQAALLAASLRTHLRCPSEIIACIPEPKEIWGVPSPTTFGLLRELGVRTAPIVNRIDPRFTHANKISCLDAPTAADKIVFLDTDMLLVKDLYDEPRFAAPLNVKPADYLMFDKSESLWEIAYRAAGVPMPAARIRSTVSNELGLPYFNSGFVAVNAGIPLADAWLNCARRVNAEPALPRPNPWSDQTALAIAVQQLQLEYDLLDDRYNYPAHVRPLPADALPWFCHYHYPRVIQKDRRLVALVQSIAATYPPAAQLMRETEEWAALLR